MSVKSQAQTGLDMASATATTTFDASNYRQIGMIVENSDGSTHVVTLQGSYDDTNWTDTAKTITGDGVTNFENFPFKYARGLVTTTEALKTADVILSGKT